jgi:hypothetical protein
MRSVCAVLPNGVNGIEATRDIQFQGITEGPLAARA